MNLSALHAELNQLPWITEMSIPAPEEMDGRWQDWSVILTRFGINAGS